MTREQLQSLSVAELRTLAKEQKVSGRWDMNKEQLIEALVALESSAVTQEVQEKEIQSEVQEEVTVTKEVDSEADNPNSESNKLKYLETIERGTLIAFRVGEKVKSAMVMERNINKQKLKVETKSKVEYIISFTDVVWVKTGKRWPRGVYELLKGGVPNETVEQTRK